MTEELSSAKKNIERYMRAGESLGHSAAAYWDASGDTRILMFSEIRVVLDALEAMMAERDRLKAAIERAKAFLTDARETSEMRNRNAYGALSEGKN